MVGCKGNHVPATWQQGPPNGVTRLEAQCQCRVANTHASVGFQYVRTTFAMRELHRRTRDVDCAFGHLSISSIEELCEGVQAVGGEPHRLRLRRYGVGHLVGV